MRGEAMQEHRVAAGLHQVTVDLIVSKGLQANGCFGFLTHRGEHVAVDHVASFDRFVGVDHHLDVSARRTQQRKVVLTEAVVDWRGDAKCSTEHADGEAKRAGHVVAIADVGHGAAFDRSEFLDDRQHVRERLHRVCSVAQ